MIRLTLPWPAKELSPNARVHWAVKSGKTSKARADAKLLTHAEIGSVVDMIGDKLLVKFTFYPSTNRRRDIDNLIAATKAHRDGIADALAVDDSKFILSAEIGEPRKPACVTVEIS